MLHSLFWTLFAKSGEPITEVRGSKDIGTEVGMHLDRLGGRKKVRVSKGCEMWFLGGSQGPTTKAIKAVVRVWANGTSWLMCSIPGIIWAMSGGRTTTRVWLITTHRSYPACHPLCKESFIKTQPHSFVYIMSMVAFLLQWQREAVTTETEFPQNLILFLCGMQLL